MSEPTAGYSVERAETAPAPTPPATPTLLQQRFLTALLGKSIRLFTTKGVCLTGTLMAHDPYTIQMDSSVIFKSAVVSIQPARDTNHTPAPGGGGECHGLRKCPGDGPAPPYRLSLLYGIYASGRQALRAMLAAIEATEGNSP